VIKLFTKFQRNRAIRGGVIAISIFDLVTLNNVLHVALASGIIFTKFDLRQLIRAWIIAFLMLIRYVTLWPWPLTRWPWKFVVHEASRNQSLYKIWGKSNNSRLSYWRFSTFSPCNFRGWGTTDRRFSGVRGRSNFTKLGRGIEWLCLHKKFVSEFRYLLAFSNAGGSKWSDVENDAKFRTLWPLWKLGERWTRSLFQLLKLYLQPNLRNTFDGHPLRGCWALWIDKKEKKRKFMGKT